MPGTLQTSPLLKSLEIKLLLHPHCVLLNPALLLLPLALLPYCIAGGCRSQAHRSARPAQSRSSLQCHKACYRVLPGYRFGSWVQGWVPRVLRWLQSIHHPASSSKTHLCLCSFCLVLLALHVGGGPSPHLLDCKSHGHTGGPGKKE